jgi:uncharacterized membrane protein YfcA
MTPSLVILFICALLAFSLSAVCGGGAGLLLMPAIGFYLPSAQLPAYIIHWYRWFFPFATGCFL